MVSLGVVLRQKYAGPLVQVKGALQAAQRLIGFRANITIKDDITFTKPWRYVIVGGGSKQWADAVFIDDREDINEYWYNGREYFPEEVVDPESMMGHLFVIHRKDSFGLDLCLDNVVKVIGYALAEKEAKSLVAHCEEKTRHGINDARGLPGSPSDVEFSYERVKPFSDRQFEKNEFDIELSFAYNLYNQLLLCYNDEREKRSQ